MVDPCETMDCKNEICQTHLYFLRSWWASINLDSNVTVDGVEGVETLVTVGFVIDGGLASESALYVKVVCTKSSRTISRVIDVSYYVETLRLFILQSRDKYG